MLKKHRFRPFFTAGLLGLSAWLLPPTPVQAKKAPQPQPQTLFQVQTEFELPEGYHLRLSTSMDDYAKVELFWETEMQEALILAHTNFEPQPIQHYKFCPTCSASLVLLLYDRSSTYGASTVIVVDRASGWWELQKLPFDRPEIADLDHDGVYEISDLRHQKHYHLEQGLLVPFEPKTP